VRARAAGAESAAVRGPLALALSMACTRDGCSSSWPPLLNLSIGLIQEQRLMVCERRCCSRAPLQLKQAS
jgi:hypothetical protein